MNFIKLNQNEKPMLVNLDNVTEVYSRGVGIGCSIYFTTGNGDNQAHISVDETLDQIYVLISDKKNGYI
jgi:hypothetical protein